MSEREHNQDPASEIPPEVAGHLREWGEQLAAIDRQARVDPFELNSLRWGLGRAMTGALDGLGSEQRITRTLEAIAGKLGKSRTYLYHLLWVARAWPEGLPRRPWTVLRKLARLPKDERDRLEGELPLDAPASALPSPEKKGSDLTPQAQQWRRDAADATEKMKLAQAAYQAIPSYLQAEFLLEQLRTVDLVEAHVVDFRRESLAAELIEAAAAIAEKLRESEAEADSSPEGDDEFDV